MNLSATFVKELSTPAVTKFCDNINDFKKEYQENGTLKLDSIIKVLGNPPRIPNSPDTDAMMEAWEEKAEYGRLAQIVEAEVERLSI